MSDFDLVIRGGAVIDGSGAEPYAGDVAVTGGRIAAVGKVAGRGREEIDARDRLVTPGFVDIHTHYDGHVTWTERLDPSSKHGVTTVLTGNCGVGFAPCRPTDRDRLVALMEGVEDIPEPVMTAGLPWNWESFADYLDRLAERRFDMDVAVQVPHAPLRVYVMGERAARREPATSDDMARMRELARGAIEAGALGFSTSRSLNHRANDGTITPSYAAETDELVSIALGLKDAGGGVLQLISDFDDVDSEFGLVRRMTQASGRPMSVSLMQAGHAPDRWRRILDHIEQANRDGLTIKGQVCGRPVGLMGGLAFTRNPFMGCPSFREVWGAPAAERLAALRDPGRRARILAEYPGEFGSMLRNHWVNFDIMYEFAEDAPDYEPRPEDSVAARAAAAGQPAPAFAYDLMTAGDGGAVFYLPVVNYVGNSTAAIETMLGHKDTILGLGDGGAHCGLICDASLPTYMLMRWVGPDRFPLQDVVKALTVDTAAAVGLRDRGLLKPGLRADINLIDLDRLSLPRPSMVPDLPTGGARISQDPTGYEATIVAGQVTYRGGQATGVLPGRLVRGAQGAAA
jgi:N-acyl-D-aspartate/D-glutamate deacylase